MSAEGWLEQGDAHRKAGRLARAEEAYRRAAELEPDTALPWLRLGLVRFRRELIRQAEAPLRRALELEPGSVVATVSLATVLERCRRLPEAEALLAPFVEGRQPPASAAMTWAGLQRRVGRPEAGLEPLRAALRHSPPGPQRGLLLFALADSLDALGRWEPAFDAFRQANLERRFPWDAADHGARVDRLIQSFSAQALASAPRAGVDSSRAVLIVGMPRSGTTLLEQVLSSHGHVAGAGELDTLRRVGLRLSLALGAPKQWFQQPRQVTADLLDQGARIYLDALAVRGGGAARITDKMPDNFLQLGLAAQMLPGCRVIHMRRDPVDAGWSCFRQAFGPGLAWSGSLEDIAAYHKDYQRLMDHWVQVQELPIVELRYEDLVSEPETSVRRVLGFLDLPWEPGCLDFHRSERLVATASHAQVQQPLHRRAVGRAAPYSPWLSALSSGSCACGTVT